MSTKNLNFAASKKRKRVYNQFEADFEDKLLELDQYNRPKVKICLISGPPGLGNEFNNTESLLDRFFTNNL